ncbi:hypothetical protein, partial [Kitasatospora setae]
MPSTSSPAGRTRALRATALGSFTTAAVLFVAAPPGAVATTAVPGAGASARLLTLENPDVPAIGLTAFAGHYGYAASPTRAAEDTGDFSDPDGVLGRVTVGSMTAHTATAADRSYAQAQLTGLEVHFRSTTLVGIEAGAIGSLDSYAQCIPAPVGPWALAYTRTDSAQITVLGRRVPVGTTELAITGNDLGTPQIGPSTLTVTVTPHQDPPTQVRQATAEAWIDITVTGTLDDLQGQPVYQGPLTTLRVGEVQVDCRAATPSPSPSPSPS